MKYHFPLIILLTYMTLLTPSYLCIKLHSSPCETPRAPTLNIYSEYLDRDELDLKRRNEDLSTFPSKQSTLTSFTTTNNSNYNRILTQQLSNSLTLSSLTSTITSLQSALINKTY